MNDASVDPRTPRATVVIPTYNYAGVLTHAIASVLDQTFRDFELLVVGDGCTDESERVVMATGDPRVQWVNLPVNTGHQSGPNNEGLRRARAEVVAYLGHDDLWLPRHLETLMSALDAGNAAAHTSVLYVEPGLPCSTGPDADWSYARGDWIAPTSMAIRRRQSVDVGGWRDVSETGYLSPEGDLVARVSDIAGPPEWVRRLTCIKLTASKRRNVYRDRPTHEQASWLARIRDADDPERMVRECIGLTHDRPGERAARESGQHARLHTRALRSVQYRLRKRLGPPRRRSAQAQLRRTRRFKGLE